MYRAGRDGHFLRISRRAAAPGSGVPRETEKDPAHIPREVWVEDIDVLMMCWGALVFCLLFKVVWCIDRRAPKKRTFLVPLNRMVAVCKRRSVSARKGRVCIAGRVALSSTLALADRLAALDATWCLVFFPISTGGWCSIYLFDSALLLFSCPASCIFQRISPVRKLCWLVALGIVCPFDCALALYIQWWRSVPKEIRLGSDWTRVT